MDTERYISFDLGDNYLYDSHTIHDYGNSGAFSNEFVKQYQAICSEVDVVLKTICKELSGITANNMPAYTDLVLKNGKLFQNKSKDEYYQIATIQKLETESVI